MKHELSPREQTELEEFLGFIQAGLSTLHDAVVEKRQRFTQEDYPGSGTILRILDTRLKEIAEIATRADLSVSLQDIVQED